MLARSPRSPVVVIYTRPWRRIVPAVRGLAARDCREWEIAIRLRISRKRVRLAMSTGAGIWSPAEWRRMCAAYAAEAANA